MRATFPGHDPEDFQFVLLATVGFPVEAHLGARLEDGL